MAVDAVVRACVGDVRLGSVVVGGTCPPVGAIEELGWVQREMWITASGWASGRANAIT
jgi:hypothetical protein